MKTLNLSEAIVLVVDDGAEYREIHRRRLEDVVGTLIITESRVDALKLIERRFFHVAVLDIRLIDQQEENVEGMELAQALFERGEATGIVIVSGYGTTDRVRDAFRKFRVVDFLEKARYTPEQFLRGIEDASIASHAYVESLRQSLLARQFIGQEVHTAFQSDLSYTQNQSFEQVFQNMLRPLVPVVAQTKFKRIEDGNILEIKLWSRYCGNAQIIRIGPRRIIQDELQNWRKNGNREESLYTMSSISGYRYVDMKLSLQDFA